MHRWLWTYFHVFYKGRKQNGDRREKAPKLEERLNTEIHTTNRGEPLQLFVREEVVMNVSIFAIAESVRSTLI